MAENPFSGLRYDFVSRLRELIAKRLSGAKSPSRSTGIQVPDVKPIRILIVAGHILIRAGLRMLLESQLGVVVVGEAVGFDDALRIAGREQPDIVLLDLDDDVIRDMDLLPQLHAAAPKTRVIVLTAIRDVRVHRRAVLLGAAGLVRKDKTADVLLQAIAKVCAGEVWFDQMD